MKRRTVVTAQPRGKGTFGPGKEGSAFQVYCVPCGAGLGSDDCAAFYFFPIDSDYGKINPMKKKRYVSIKLKLCVYIILLTLTFCIFLLFGVGRLYQEKIERNMRLYMEEAIGQLGSNISYTLQSMEENLVYKIMSSGILVDSKNAGELEQALTGKSLQKLAALLNNTGIHVRELCLIDTEGKAVYYDVEKHDAGTLSSFRHPEVAEYLENFYEMYAQPRGKTTWMRFDADKECLYLLKSVLELDSSEYKGILCIAIEEDYLKEMYASIEKNLSSSIVIYDEEGKVLSCDDDFLETAEDYESTLEKREEESYRYQEYYLSSAELKGKGWTIVCFSSDVVVRQEMNELFAAMLMLMGLILILVCLAAYRMSVRMTMNIDALIQNFEEIKAGREPESIRPASNDETAYLCDQFQKMSRDLKQSAEKTAYSVLEKEKAEYNALLAQMNPHFLYNTLESISSLARLHGNSDVVSCIQKLGSLLRVSISGKRMEIPLREELDYVKLYMELQNLIMGDRISWDMDISSEVEECLVPKLILQPIVENSMIHGVENMSENAMILIAAREEEGKLILEVSDNGCGMDEKTIQSVLKQDGHDDRKHIGVNSVLRRIQILYGMEYGLYIESEVGIGTVVRLTLPFLRKNTTR